jgi:hypothetical protein
MVKIGGAPYFRVSGKKGSLVNIDVVAIGKGLYHNCVR